MSARRDRRIALATLKAADRAWDRVALDDLTRASREFSKDGSRLDTALGLSAGIVAGLLVIWRWLR